MSKAHVELDVDELRLLMYALLTFEDELRGVPASTRTFEPGQAAALVVKVRGALSAVRSPMIARSHKG